MQSWLDLFLLQNYEIMIIILELELMSTRNLGR